MTKFLLEIDDAQADVLVLALDAFSRLHMGQMDSVIDDISLHHDGRFRDEDSPNKITDEYFEWRDRLKEIARCLGKVFTGMSESVSFGIRAPEIPDLARVAWDLHQVIRHCVSWKRCPEGRPWSCHFDDPFITSSKVQLAKCEVKQETQDAKKEKSETNNCNRPERKRPKRKYPVRGR
jgi:hypothetical protein